MAAATRSAVFATAKKPRTSPCLPSTSYSSELVLWPYRNVRNYGTVVGKRGLLTSRCEIGSSPFLMTQEEKKKKTKEKESRISSISALEILKTSAADRYTKKKSRIIAIGLNFHTAPVEMREKLDIPESGWPHAIEELCCLNHIEEAAVLRTCNRIEIYVVALSWHPGILEVTSWMSKRSGIPVSELQHHLLLLGDNDAVRHLFEVAAGLDSVVLGEVQVLSQVKQAFQVGMGVKGLSRTISGLFKHAITVGKRVQHETNIAAGAVSVSSAAVELALMKLPKSAYSRARILVIGAGKMGKLVLKHLAAKGCTKVVVVNRSEDRVAAIRDELKDMEIIYKPFSEMLSCAAEADVVFTSTASETPLFLKEHVESLPPVSQELGCLRLFIDISVPRNVGSCACSVRSAQVYNVDHLKDIDEANKEDRHREASEVQAIIDEELNGFKAWRDSLGTVPTIKKLRSYFEQVRISELENYLSKKGVCDHSNEAVTKLSKGMIDKLLCGPVQHLRCDPDGNQPPCEIFENMRVINRIFGLDTDNLFSGRKIRAKAEKTEK